jgi:hypothetical protein
MKTSNYIIIAFFVFLFGGVFVLFLSSKIHQGDSDSGVYSEEKKLEPFSVVVAEPGAEFHLRNAEYPRMRSFYQKPDTCGFLEYGIRNDTLFVFAISGNKQPRLPHEIYARNLKSIVAKENSYISLQEFQADTLIVNLNNAVLDAFFDQTKNHASSLSIQAISSKINLTRINVDNLNIQLNETTLNAWNNSIVGISGSLTDHSSLSVDAMNKINVEVDSTSTYHLNKYDQARK